MIAVILAILTSTISVSLAKINQFSNSNFVSTRIALQAQAIADSKMKFLALLEYEDIVSQNRAIVTGTSYYDSIVISSENNLGDGLLSKAVTVNVFYSDETAPRYRLTKIFYNNGNNEFVFNDSTDSTRIGMLYSGNRIITRLDDSEQKLLTNMTTSYSGNLNNLSETGFFNGSNLTNAPSTAWYYIENIRHSNMSNYYINQKVTNFENGKIYHRQCRNGTWSSWSEIGGSSGAFTGWNNSFPASGTAPSDGIICAKSISNTIVSITTSGVERVYTAKRDKYGQGSTSITCPVKKGESYSVSGATYIRFMQIGN